MTQSRLDTLDLLRGVAALMVLSSHARGFILESFAELEASGTSVNPAIKAFYLFTGLGHEAVIVFFALSGFLVGGQAIERCAAGKFSYPRYMVRRLTRLWIVMVPALILTVLLDQTGMMLAAGRGYDGAFYKTIMSGPTAAANASLAPITFLGNLLFVQTIAVPVMGSNGPLWSLANEFWYYVMGPLILLGSGVMPVSLLTRSAAITALGVLLVALPFGMVAAGSIWVAGAGAAWLSKRMEAAGFLQSYLVRGLAVAALCAVLIGSKSQLALGDIGMGLVVAATLPVLAGLPITNRHLRFLARGSSDISYTLYLTHFPLLMLVAVTGFLPGRWPPTAEGLAVYGLLVSLAIIWAIALWWLFERNTDRVYAALSQALGWR